MQGEEDVYRACSKEEIKKLQGDGAGEIFKY